MRKNFLMLAMIATLVLVGTACKKAHVCRCWSRDTMDALALHVIPNASKSEAIDECNKYESDTIACAVCATCDKP